MTSSSVTNAWIKTNSDRLTSDTLPLVEQLKQTAKSIDAYTKGNSTVPANLTTAYRLLFKDVLELLEPASAEDQDNDDLLSPP